MATSLPVSGGQDDEIISLEKVLTEHHLSDIVSATYGARAKWRAIGLALRLTSSTLDVIALETHTVDDKYEQVLIRWIRKGAVTRDLVAALERNTVNENRLASELILKYERRTLSINEDATPDVKIVIQEIRILKREFSQIVNKVKQVAVEKKWTNDTVVSLLTIEFPLRYTSSHPIVFVKKNMQEITNAESIKELWGHLCLHWNIMNTDLLEYIIDELENYNLTTEMNAFIAKVSLFRSKTAIKVYMKAEAIEPLMEDIEQNLEILVTSHIPKELSGNFTLEDAEIFRKKFAKMYMLREVVLCICKISDLRRYPERLDALDKNINKEDFPGIIAILQPITNKWKDIGLVLNIERQVLANFENNPELAKGGPEGLLIETLNTLETLTVKTLLHVLRSPSVQEEDIAQAVEEHFLTTRGKVNVEIAMLAQSFESLKTSASRKENLKTKQIHKYLIRLYPDNAIPKPVAVELESAHSSLDYFSILTRHGMWSYINHHLLEIIIKEMVPRDNELRKQIVQYRDEVDIFARNTAIHDYIDLHQMQAVEAVANVMPVDLHAPYPEMFTFFQMKFELSFANKSLKHILTIQQQLMKHFSLPHPTLLLGKVSRGSVAINWYFPRVETERICSVANSSEYFFRELNVIQVNIDDNFKLRIDQTAERQEVRSSDNELQVRVILGEFPVEKAVTISSGGRGPSVPAGSSCRYTPYTPQPQQRNSQSLSPGATSQLSPSTPLHQQPPLTPQYSPQAGAYSPLSVPPQSVDVPDRGGDMSLLGVPSLPQGVPGTAGQQPIPADQFEHSTQFRSPQLQLVDVPDRGGDMSLLCTPSLPQGMSSTIHQQQQQPLPPDQYGYSSAQSLPQLPVPQNSSQVFAQDSAIYATSFSPPRPSALPQQPDAASSSTYSRMASQMASVNPHSPPTLEAYQPPQEFSVYQNPPLQQRDDTRRPEKKECTQSDTTYIPDLFSVIKHLTALALSFAVSFFLDVTIDQPMKLFPRNDRPDLVNLFNFPVTPQSSMNVIRHISAHYVQLGTILLQDRTGRIMQATALSHNYRPSACMHAIICEWLEGSGRTPVTWSGFVTSLKDAELFSVANTIEAVLIE